MSTTTNRALSVLAACCGLLAGFGGVEHGYFEILQGNVAPDGLMIASMGPPCVAAEVWHACEPAMTILPSFLWTGVISLILGVITFVWSGWFVRRRHGGTVLMLLSVALLLFGGGIFPPVIGIVGGLIGRSIHTQLTGWRARMNGTVGQLLSAAWPWSVVVLFGWLFAQFIVGRFFNDFLLNSGILIPSLILGLLLLSILSAYARDARAHDVSRKSAQDS